MNDVILNRNEVLFKEYGNIDFSNLEPISVKNCDLDEYVLNAEFSRIVTFLEDAKDIYFKDSENVIVDVKFHNLRKGQYPCIPGWHTDGSLFVSKNRPQPEKYLLYITGDICFTEFCHDEIVVPRKRESLDFMRDHKAQKISALSSGSFALYDSTNMHRGTKSEIDGKRLLIRMMISDKIEGLPYSQSLFTPFNM